MLYLQVKYMRYDIQKYLFVRNSVEYFKGNFIIT